jgi:uncharacterized protein YecA (UPF0149 family)
VVSNTKKGVNMNTTKDLKNTSEENGSHEHVHVHGPNCNHGHHHEILKPIVRETPKIGRNDLCTCGSEKKFKKCCGK